jgi:hypothetical protein
MLYIERYPVSLPHRTDLTTHPIVAAERARLDTLQVEGMKCFYLLGDGCCGFY